MKILCLALFLQSSVQLQCEPRQVQATIGGSFTLTCQYDTGPFLFSQKYWCLGESRNTCEILTDTDGFTKEGLKGRIVIHDAHRRGLFVIMRDLQFADTGKYWVGINKMYADVMTKISITVSEVAVSKPRVSFLSPSSETCWGQSLTLRCRSELGTNVRYTWRKAEGSRDVTLQGATDLRLHCGIVGDGERYYCVASNSVSTERSRPVSAQLLRPAGEDCVYILAMDGEPQYDCWHRLRTTTVPSLETTPTTEEDRGSASLSTPVNHSGGVNASMREWPGVPVWYEALRWLLLASLLAALCLARSCSPGPAPRVRGTRTSS
ncbi:hypothetical protein AAFF_G00280330 [Aldrovandia affinis]|uniref:Ig-like domain-containing protein n=1 Tax=Aldrovandia affinis TaxID=143900 RepID=A0AAD7W176_9TELE|nr:hypothetical protein AAFF_G00280330 [Aldrovandia affinis]